MKKIFLIGFLAISLLLFGCAQNDLPPEPPAPGETGGGAFAGQAIAGGNGFAKFDSPAAQSSYFKVDFGAFPEGARGILVAAPGDDYVYKIGYASINNGEWTPFEFDQEIVGGSNWVKGDASTLQRLSPTEVGLEQNSNGFIAYACSKKDGSWDCHGNKWMLWQFGVEDMYCYDDAEACPAGYVCDTQCVELPDAPILPPGSTSNLACGTVVEENDEFYISEMGFQYQSASNIYDTILSVRIKDLKTGETYERTGKVVQDKVTFDLKLEGNTYTFLSASDPSLDDWSFVLGYPICTSDICTSDDHCFDSKEFYCSDSGQPCTKVTSYDCIEGACVARGGGGSCQAEPCANGCYKGFCMEETRSWLCQEYNVKFDGTDEATVKFIVNGEHTGTLAEDESFITSGGAALTVKDILYQDYAGGLKQAEYTLEWANTQPEGEKLVLDKENANIARSTSVYEVKVTSMTSEGARFEVNGEASGLLKEGESVVFRDGSLLTVKKVLYQDYAGGIHQVSYTFDDTYLPVGESITHNVGCTDYEVQLAGVSETAAGFSVNGQDSGNVVEGDGTRLPDGSWLDVRKIFYQAYPGGLSQATYQLDKRHLLQLGEEQTVKVTN